MGDVDAWGMGWGWWGLGHLLWWALLIVGLAVLLRWAWGRRRDDERMASPPPPQAPAAPPPDPALLVLRERFARGEIDEAEYRHRLQVLGG